MLTLMTMMKTMMMTMMMTMMTIWCDPRRSFFAIVCLLKTEGARQFKPKAQADPRISHQKTETSSFLVPQTFNHNVSLFMEISPQLFGRVTHNTARLALTPGVTQFGAYHRPPDRYMSNTALKVVRGARILAKRRLVSKNSIKDQTFPPLLTLPFT